jgi:hypothetical protein
MQLVNYVTQQLDNFEQLTSTYPEFSDVILIIGQYQGEFSSHKKDNIKVNLLIPSVNSTFTTCKKQLLVTVILQLKLNFCIKRNPNYDLYFNMLEMLKQDTDYIDFLSSDILIEKGRGLITINASKIAVVRL